MGHMSGSPEALWPIFSPLTPLFCVLNGSIKNADDCISTSAAVDAKTLWPHLKAMSSRKKVALFDLDPMYYPGWRRKKYEIIIMSYSPWRRESPEALAMIEICLMTWRGIGFT